jgi:hypothetical protein
LANNRLSRNSWDDVITANPDSINVSSSGCFGLAKDASGKHIPRMQSSADAMSTPGDRLRILDGPLSEEPGWRGFVVTALTGHLPLLPTSLVAGALWFAWHLPLFWLGGAAQSGSSIALFGVTLMALSVVFTWLYLQCPQSLLPVFVLHTSVNTLSFGLGTILPGVDEARSYAYAFFGITILIAPVLLLRSRFSHGRGVA